MLKKTVGFISLFILISFLTTAGIFLFQEGTQPLPALAAQSGPYERAYNYSGLSEVAVKVLWSEPIGKYDLVYFTVNPVVGITGSGCTVESGTTSLPSAPDGEVLLPYYANGGVTLVPASLKLNEVIAFWQADNPKIDNKSAGISGASNAYTYEWVSGAGSGATNWKLKVYKLTTIASSSGTTVYYDELTTTSGGSIYVGPTWGMNSSTLGLSGSSLSYTSSTTFYASHQLGWWTGITPYFFALGKR